MPLVASGEMQIPVPPRVGGKTSIRIQVPNDQSLIGKTAFSQALILDPIGPSRFTNVVADRIIR